MRKRNRPTASVTALVSAGLAAGAAGTAALNGVTYLDMALRGRPSSSAPAELAGKVAERLGINALGSPNNAEAAANRRTAVGALSGFAAGLGGGAALGLARAAGLRLPVPVGAVALGVGVSAAADLPLAAAGVSDPRTWSASAWASDVVPHLVYGALTASVFDRLASAR